MPKNVMKLLKPSPNLGKNGFDLSHRSLFDANMGELLPCCCIETVPDDDVEIKVADLLRAQPLVTSPFMRVKQHIDFWFVPYNSMWHQWNAFLTSRDEPSSTNLKSKSYVPHFNLRALKNAIEGNGAVPSLFGSNAQFKLNAWRLLDLLGYPTYDKFYGDPLAPPTVYDDVDVNAWRLLAYHYIWYHEYRQKYYDNGGLGFNSPYTETIAAMFNVDYCTCQTYSSSNILTEAASAFSGQFIPGTGLESVLCQMRYRPWKKDLFTGLLPSTQLGVVSIVQPDLSQVRLVNADFTTTTGTVTGGKNPNGHIVMSNGGGTGLVTVTNNAKFDILALRASQALQIWRENALRAGNQIQDNYRAHYGVEPHSHMVEHPIALGSIDAPLNISDVMATADTGMGTGNDAVGDIAGKGISSLDGNKTLRFKTNDFGVIMGIFSLLPEAEYNSTGIDRENQLLERFDYFCPEMENLGLEALDGRTFNIGTNLVAGYTPRYIAYKTKMDKAHLRFHNNPLSGYDLGPYRQWASAKYDIGISSNGIPLSQLYVNPAVFDVNFVAASGLVSQFLVDMYKNVTAVRPLSVSGLPSK